MFKTNYLAATMLGAAMLLSAGTASAAGLTSSQISAILSLLQSFGADPTTVNNVSAALGGTTTTSSGKSCVTLTRDLTIGSTGSDVTEYQTYLISQGYLASGNNTGYYGYLTADATGRMQISKGILTSTDQRLRYVEAKTRNVINCVTTTVTDGASAYLQASLSSGPAPLTVSFTGSGGNKTYVGGVMIDYGDNTSDTLCNAGQSCSKSSITHTYNASGNFTARLIGYDVGKNVEIARTTVAVGQDSGSPSATIDQKSLTAISANPIITGTARNTTQVAVSVMDEEGVIIGSNNHLIGFVSSDGRWQVGLINLAPRSYNVYVYDASSNVKLTSGRLTISVVY